MPPRCALVYFSQTGNTKKVAERIHGGLSAAGVATELIPMKSAKNQKIKNSDIIGIGTPVFFYREPLNVERFIKNLPSLKNRFAFVFVTYGGHKSNSIERMAIALRQKGATVLGDFSALGYDTFQPWDGMEIAKGHPDVKELKAAEVFGRAIAEKYAKIKKGERVTLPRYKIKLDFWLPVSMFTLDLAKRTMLPKKKINKSKCNQCERCAKNCPTDNITMNPYPTLGNDCIYCYFCEKVCTKKAIECRWSPAFRILKI